MVIHPSVSPAIKRHSMAAYREQSSVIPPLKWPRAVVLNARADGASCLVSRALSSRDPRRSPLDRSPIRQRGMRQYGAICVVWRRSCTSLACPSWPCAHSPHIHVVCDGGCCASWSVPGSYPCGNDAAELAPIYETCQRHQWIYYTMISLLRCSDSSLRVGSLLRTVAVEDMSGRTVTRTRTFANTHMDKQTCHLICSSATAASYVDRRGTSKA